MPDKHTNKGNISISSKAPARRNSSLKRETESKEEDACTSQNKPKKHNKHTKTVESDRLPKRLDHPIQQHNRFSCLPENMEADSHAVDEKSKQGKITRLPKSK